MFIALDLGGFFDLGVIEKIRDLEGCHNRMKYADVAENMKRLLNERPSNDEFVYELLLAYGTPKATVARLKKGQLNLAQEPGEVLLKKKLWFKAVSSDLFDAMEDLKSDKATKTNDPRFLIVTDFEHMLAVDRKTDDTLDVELSELETHFDFFLPWAGMEKTKLSNENPADVKAAEKMAKLFDVIKQDNLDYVRDNPHGMNIFLSRLLFCLYAEDTGIFPKNAVCNAIASYTAVDGTDLPEFFTTLFDWLDKSDRERNNIEYRTSNIEHRRGGSASSASNDKGSFYGIRELPYVNGGLFKDHYPVPQFSAKSRRMIIESGTLNWSEINPDIFGSMFQAVIDPAERHNLGQHYTSVTNIMKVIEPLFLNDFKAELEKAREMTRGKMQALNRLLDRIANVKIFDPACGSGNFLIIAYKELRRLEIAVFQELEKIEPQFILSRMSVSQFYGIEIADFACETAILALWLAQHQMNVESRRVIGKAPVSLPLKEGANIVCGNACRLDWESVCPKNEGDEIYIMGNPPYLGSSMQNKEQKTDMDHVFRGINNYKNLDYIACWFFKGAEYIQDSKFQYAFVSTNSICQGEQVALLWPHIFNKGLEIGFAHQSFKWTNNAKGNAGVTCVIIGVRNKNNEASTIFRHGVAQNVKVINAYLTAGSEVIVQKRSGPLSRIPKMSYGNKPVDGGHLILSDAEKESLLAAFPEARKYIRKLLGADEFINGISRWCLWIADDEVDEASNIPPIRERIEKVKAMRLASRDQSANEMAKTAHRFREQKCSKLSTVIVPATTSERREYIPMGFLAPDTILTNLAQAIYDPEPWIFGVISSLMHMVWVRATCGMLETRIRYSSSLCYNTFPIPDLTDAQKHTITMHVGEVLSEREKHSEKTMAQLYDPDKMPAGLREAHHQLDLAVDRLYRSKPFTSDEERLEHLFKLYEEMVQQEEINDTPAKKLLKNRILAKLKSERAYFSLAQIAEAAAGLDLSERALKNYMSEFAKEGIVFDAGRGWYSSLEGKLSLRKEPVQQWVSLLRERFPFLEFACWSTEQLNPFMHHMLSRFVTLLYVERDAMESVAGALQEAGMSVHVNPGKQELSRIVASKDQMVVIRPSIKKQPMDSSGYAQEEKILVDFMIENGHFKWVEVSEAEHVVKNALTAGRIDRGCFEMYKHERQLDWSADV